MTECPMRAWITKLYKAYDESVARLHQSKEHVTRITRIRFIPKSGERLCHGLFQQVLKELLGSNQEGFTGFTRKASQLIFSTTSIR